MHWWYAVNRSSSSENSAVPSEPYQIFSLLANRALNLVMTQNLRACAVLHPNQSLCSPKSTTRTYTNHTPYTRIPRELPIGIFRLSCCAWQLLPTHQFYSVKPSSKSSVRRLPPTSPIFIWSFWRRRELGRLHGQSGELVWKGRTSWRTADEIRWIS